MTEYFCGETDCSKNLGLDFFLDIPVCSYEGDMVDGKFEGRAKITFCDGSVYEGELEDNSITGTGIYYYTDGHKYVGEWLWGDFHGAGTFYCPENGEITGLWCHGEIVLSADFDELEVIIENEQILNELH